MFDWLNDLLEILSDPQRRAAIDFLWAKIAAISAALISLFGWVTLRRKKSTAKSTPLGFTQNTEQGANVLIDGDGNSVSIGNVTVGITLEQHEDSLRRRESELEAKFEAATAEARDIAARELASVRSKLENTEVSFEDTKAKLEELKNKLSDIAGDVSPEAMAKAQRALAKGERGQADSLLAEVEAAEEASIKRAAEAAYARGEIAEQEIRWVDAAAHFHRASQLNPSYDYLRKSWDFYWKMGEHQAALAQAEELIKGALNDYGEGSFQHGLALSFKATTLGNMGRLGEAEGFHIRAIEIIEAVKGIADPAVAIEYSNYGLLLDALRRSEEAKEQFNKAIAIVKDQPVERQNYAKYINNLANLHFKQTDYEKALEGFIEAGNIFRNEFPQEHPIRAFNLNNRAEALAHLDRRNEAEPLYTKALKILTESVGPDHQITRKVQMNYDKFKTAS